MWPTTAQPSLVPEKKPSGLASSSYREQSACGSWVCAHVCVVVVVAWAHCRDYLHLCFKNTVGWAKEKRTEGSGRLRDSNVCCDDTLSSFLLLLENWENCTNGFFLIYFISEWNKRDDWLPVCRQPPVNCRKVGRLSTGLRGVSWTLKSLNLCIWASLKEDLIHVWGCSRGHRQTWRGGGGVGLGSCLLASSSLTFSLSLTAPPAPCTGYCTMLCPNPNTTPGFVCRFFVFF